MDQLLKDVGNSLSGVFSSDVVQLGIKAVGIYIVFLWLATSLWAYQDMKSRTSNPLLPYLAAALIIVFTPLLFLFAALLYRIIRPHERVGEAHERMLAEEAMLAEVEQIDHCLGCGRRVDEGWLVCPTCRARLRRVCPNCGKLVGTDWLLCAWCGTDFEVSQARGLAASAGPYATPQPGSRQAGRAPVRQAAPIAAAAVASERAAPASERAAPASEPPVPTPDRYGPTPDTFATTAPASAPRQEARRPLDDVPPVRDDPRPAAAPPASWAASTTDPYAGARDDGLSTAYASPEPAPSTNGAPPPEPALAETDAWPADATAPLTTSRTRTRRPSSDQDASPTSVPAADAVPAPAATDAPATVVPPADDAPAATSSGAPISGRRAAQR